MKIIKTSFKYILLFINLIVFGNLDKSTFEVNK